MPRPSSGVFACSLETVSPLATCEATEHGGTLISRHPAPNASEFSVPYGIPKLTQKFFGVGASMKSCDLAAGALEDTNTRSPLLFSRMVFEIRQVGIAIDGENRIEYAMEGEQKAVREFATICISS